MHIVDEVNHVMAPLLRMVESLPKEPAETGPMKVHRRFNQELRAKLVTSERWLQRKLNQIEEKRHKINKSRSEPLTFNWNEAAESSYLAESEKIHVDVAGPQPKNIREAMRGKFWKYFLRAMLMEMESLMNLKVWEVTKLPKGKKAINSRWVYAYKLDPYGYITRFKARLVAVGYTQQKGSDYNETHSPVVKSKVVRLLIAMSAVLGMSVEQLDVDTAYLYGTLTETNYMRLPHGFEEYDEDGNLLVGKLIKSLYGLHQSGREWYKVLSQYLVSIGFHEMKSEPCAFWRICAITKSFVIILIYVDDIIMASPNPDAIKQFKDEIKKRFSIKDIGEAEWILKVQSVKFPGKGVWRGQSSYAKSILTECGMWDIPESSWKKTPMTVTWTHDTNSPLLSPEAKSAYRSKVMKVLYLATSTRLDIHFAITTLMQFQDDCRECENEGLTRILQYIRGTVDLGNYFDIGRDDKPMIFVSKEDAVYQRPLDINLVEGYAPEVYTDASYGQESDRKSRSGYVTFAFGSVISWYSKKQATTALSSTEAEINAMVEGVKEAKWLREFLLELGFTLEKPTLMQQDNQSAIAIAINPVHHSRIKHLEVKTHFLRENIEGKEVEFLYCPTELMLADILTKALPREQHWKLVKLLGMKSLKDLQDGKFERSMIVRRNL